MPDKRGTTKADATSSPPPPSGTTDQFNGTALQCVELIWPLLRRLGSHQNRERNGRTRAMRQIIHVHSANNA